MQTREELIEYYKKWRRKNNTYCREFDKKRREERRANWSVEDWSIFNSHRKEYIKELRQKKKSLGTYDYRRDVIGRIKRASSKGIPIDSTITYEDIPILDFCPCCGIRMNHSRETPMQNYSIDRIIPEKGYIRGNMIVVCKRCNTIKNDATVAELFQVAEFVKRMTEQVLSKTDNNEDSTGV